MVKFCTKCGFKLEDKDLFCRKCGAKQHMLNKKDMGNGQFNIPQNSGRVFGQRHSKKLHFQKDAPIRNKIREITGKNISDSDYFKVRRQTFNAKENHVYYKYILNSEVDSNNLKYGDVESRLDELLQINDAKVLYDLRFKRPTHLFKTRQDLEQYIGYGTKDNPIPISDEEMEKINKKIKNSGSNRSSALKNILSEESHKKAVELIKETKKVNISIPDGKKLLNSPLTGALTGDIVGSGVGHMIGGLAGAGSVLGSTMGALNGGLILGGAGALIGGLLAASDDGIEWFDTILVLDEKGAIIAGKIFLPYKDIKHINAEKGDKFDVVTLTMENYGLQFKTSHAMALKEVMDEMIGVELNNVEHEQIPVTNENDNVEVLMKYAELYEMGLLTAEEFESKKKELL